MNTIEELAPSGYEIVKEVYKNNKYQILKAREILSNLEYTLKRTRNNSLGIYEVSKLSNEFEILKNLKHKGLLKINDIISEDKIVTLIYEWFEGESLKLRVAKNKLSLEEFFPLAIQICDVINYINNSGVIHKDINPSNILIGADGNIKLIDFGISTSLQAQESSTQIPQQIEGTLIYLSPEQTGRTGYAITTSSDLYSLGILFFELLAGYPPFYSKDALEIIHYHLSRKPVWLQTINPDLPFGLCAVIDQLLEKNPDNRYQSASGLLADIQFLSDLYCKNSSTDNFIPRRFDKIITYKEPQTLYGRDEEIKKLLNCLDDLEVSNSSLVLVSGYSGVGKSALVKQIQQPVINKKGTFIIGKFDQFKQNIPYFSFIEAFTELIRTILSESEEKIQEWNSRISQVLGENGGLITELIPLLEHIIGKQSPVAKLQPAEQEFRFRMVMLDFIYSLINPGTPMVIFLDDLQWADIPSLNLIERILLTPRHGQIMILGAYRDNEVNETHPLSITLKQLTVNNITINEIKLKPLDIKTTCHIVADSFGLSLNEGEELGQLVYKKTNGNPFFINRFLKSIYKDGYISINTSGKWHWDIEIISNLGYTDNVIDLMTREMVSLPTPTLEALKMASVLGGTFKLTELGLLLNRTQYEVFEILNPAIMAGYLLPLDNTYRMLLLTREGIGKEWDAESAKLVISFKFLHDRVQQAMYALINENEKSNIHLHTGRTLFANIEEEKLVELVFDIIWHFAIGVPLIKDPIEQQKISRLFLLGGKKAKDSTSYDLAVKYMLLSLELNGQKGWNTNYNHTFDIYIELGECEYLNSNHDSATFYFEELLKYAQSDYDKLRVYYIKSSLYLKLSKIGDSLQTGRIAMKLFNIQFPENKFVITLFTLFNLIKYLILFSTKYKNPEKLFHLKECEDPKIIAINQFLIDMSTSAYQENQELMMLIIFKIIEQYFKYGFTDASGWGFSGFSVVTLSSLGLSKSGFNLWEITKKLHQRTHSNLIKRKLEFTVRAFGNHWNTPLSEDLDDILDTTKGCMMNGDPIFTGYCIGIYVWIKSATGYPIPDFIELTKDLIDYLNRNKNSSGLDRAIPRIQAMKALAGLTNSLSDWDDENYSGEETFKNILASGNKTLVAFFYCAKLPILFYSGKYKETVDWSLEGTKYRENLLGQYLVVEWYFYTCLSIASIYNQVNKEEKKTVLKEFNAGMKWMKIWDRDCPQNYEHMHKLLLAEQKIMQGNFDEPAQLFDEAIVSASKNGYIYIEAIGNERAAHFYFERKKEKIANLYLREAYQLYKKWGALGKCKDLENKYQILNKNFYVDTVTKTDLDLTQTSGTQTVLLDLSTILKASESLTSHVKLDDLLQNLMHIVIENAGAERGCLLYDRKGVLCIEAEGNSGEKGNLILPSIPFQNSKLVPETLIQYCWRVEETIVETNAFKNAPYNTDTFVLENKILSMLCMPITEKGVKIGLLYLENNLVEGVFTKKRLDLLNLLSGQIGISIQNAMLYDNLEEKVRERTLEIKKQQVQIEEEMKKSDKLLLNILPEQTAHELKTLGYSKAIRYENVHVYFCDIVGFTKRVERMGAEQIVEELHEFFSGVDDIVKKYKIEKIKTIGDAYLCASGLNEETDNMSAVRMVRASIEILNFVDQLNTHKVKNGKSPFNIRVGIHSGPVIAGVVGKSKFAYDIWGDTVNTAARMESSGEEGKINISGVTYEQVKNHIKCQHRGKLEAKNKGLMDMYFVER